MKYFEEKKIIRSRLYSRTSVVLLIILLLILGKAVWNIYGKELQSRKERDVAEKKLTELKERESTLKAQTEALKTDFGKEEEIRSKFGVAKPGEEVIIVVPKEKEKPQEEQGWFEGIWQKIKSIFG